MQFLRLLFFKWVWVLLCYFFMFTNIAFYFISLDFFCATECIECVTARRALRGVLGNEWWWPHLRAKEMAKTEEAIRKSISRTAWLARLRNAAARNQYFVPPRSTRRRKQLFLRQVAGKVYLREDAAGAKSVERLILRVRDLRSGCSSGARASPAALLLSFAYLGPAMPTSTFACHVTRTDNFAFSHALGGWYW